jgi:hypothetical protein
MADFTAVSPPQEMILRIADNTDVANSWWTNFEQFRGYKDFETLKLAMEMTSTCLGNEAEVDALLQKRQSELHEQSYQLLQMPPIQTSNSLQNTGHISALTYRKETLAVENVIAAKRTVNFAEYQNSDIASNFEQRDKLAYGIAKETLHAIYSILQTVQSRFVTFLRNSASIAGGQGRYFTPVAGSRRIGLLDEDVFKKVQANSVRDKFPITGGRKVKILGSVETMVLKNLYDKFSENNQRNDKMQLDAFDFRSTDSIDVLNAATDESTFFAMHEGAIGLKYYVPDVQTLPGYDVANKELSVITIPANFIPGLPEFKMGVFISKDMLNTFATDLTQLSYLNRTYDMIFFLFPVHFTAYSSDVNHRAIVSYIKDLL